MLGHLKGVIISNSGDSAARLRRLVLEPALEAAGVTVAPPEDKSAPDIAIIDLLSGMELDVEALERAAENGAAVFYIVASHQQVPPKLAGQLSGATAFSPDLSDPTWGGNLKEALVAGLQNEIAERESRLKAPKVAAQSKPSVIALVQVASFREASITVGNELRAGAMAHFNTINAAGGVNGQQIELRSFNDHYEPDEAEKQTLEHMAGASLFFGCVGTPTAKRIVPILMKAKVPFFGAYTGADFLREDHDPSLKKHFNVVNVRNGYRSEVRELIKHARLSHQKSTVFCLHQNDEYGESVRSNTERWAKEFGLNYVGSGSYTRNMLDIDGVVADIVTQKPEVVVLGGVSGPCAKAIIDARKAGLKDTLFMCVSFVGPAATRNELGPAFSSNVFFSTVVPSPWSSDLPVVKDYREVMNEPDYSFESLEGYINARVFTDIASRISGPFTRERFMEAVINTGMREIGGISLYYDKSSHNGLDFVSIYKIAKGEFVDVGR
jgi:branched-chain amino acid transport system substrate-binding protein